VAICRRCKTGKIECPECTGNGYETCSACGGSGDIDDNYKCSICYGSGRVDCIYCDGNRVVNCEYCGGSDDDDY
jgi:hypothetical protein